jgi:hypothetical protein
MTHGVTQRQQADVALSQTIPADFAALEVDDPTILPAGFPVGEASDAELQDAVFGSVPTGADGSKSGGVTQLPAITVTPSDSAADSSIDYMQPIPGSEQSDLGAFLAAPGQVIRTHNYGQSAPDDAPLLVGGSGVDFGPRIGFIDYFKIIGGGLASYIPEGVRDFEYSRIVAESTRLSSVDNIEYDGIDDYSVGNGKGWTLSLPTVDDVKTGLSKAYNALASTFGEGQNAPNVSNLEYHDIDSYPEDVGSGWRLSVPTEGDLVDFSNSLYAQSLSASHAYRTEIEKGEFYRAGLAWGGDPMAQGLGLMVGTFGLTKPLSASGRFTPNNPSQGVRFFGEQDLKYFTADNATLGNPNGAAFFMPVEDAALIRNTSDALRYTGHSPSILKAQETGSDIYGISFSTKGLEVRQPTSVDAGGWPHFLEGGNTAVRLPDPNGGFLVNPTREFVTPGSNAIPEGTVLFKLGPNGEWIPKQRF